MQILGIEKVDYVSKKSGNPVSGYRLHCAFEKKNCEGVAVESYFARDQAFENGIPEVGDDVTILYNRYGNVQTVTIS